MINNVFHVSGDKISAFIMDENSLKFSSSTADSVEEFRESFAKKLSLATKTEIKYDAIKFIKKEEGNDKVLIKYKTFVGIPGECEFSFTRPGDYGTFVTFFEKERYFTKNVATSTAFSVIRNYLIGLLATIGFAIFVYFHAIEIENGSVKEATRSKERIFNNIVGAIGDKGVLAIGAIVSGYLIYRIWKRYSNPPNQTRLVPPHA